MGIKRVRGRKRLCEWIELRRDGRSKERSETCDIGKVQGRCHSREDWRGHNRICKTSGCHPSHEQVPLVNIYNIIFTLYFSIDKYK